MNLTSEEIIKFIKIKKYSSYEIIKKLKLINICKTQKAIYLHILLGSDEINNLLKKQNKNSIIYYNFIKIIELLILKGADINYTPNNSVNLLMIAIMNNYNKVVKILIENKININYVAENLEVHNALTIAIVLNNSIAFQLLIKQQVLDVNKINYLGKNALFYAVKNNKFYYAKYLIKLNANINHMDNNNNTVLKYAIDEHNINLIKKIIKNKNFDINYINDINNDILFNLLNIDKEIIFELVDKGLDLNKTNDNDIDVYKYLIMNNKTDLIYELLCFTDINKVYKDGSSLLIYTIKYNCINLAIQLIRDGINIHMVNKNNESAFNLIYKKNNKLYQILMAQKKINYYKQKKRTKIIN